MKNIYIILTRTESIVSKFVHFFTLDEYTHAAIAFGDELEAVYSSSRKNGVSMFPAGPCREYFDRGFYARVGRTPCAVFRLTVPDEVYDRAREEIDYFMLHQDEYKFNVLGLIGCRFGINWYRKNKFFCSQFVAEILIRSNALQLPKKSVLMRPCDYISLPELTCCFEGDIGELMAFRKNLVA